MFGYDNLFNDLRSLGAINPYEAKDKDFEIENDFIWTFNNQEQELEGIIGELKFEPMSDDELFPVTSSVTVSDIEIIAYYKPIHFYDEENWGIVIKFRPLAKFSNKVRNFIINNSKIPTVKSFFEVSSFRATELSLKIAEEIVLRHEMYHHSMESFAIRTELIRNFTFKSAGLGYDTPIVKPIESFYKRYRDESNKKGIYIPPPIGAQCNWEEALANYEEKSSDVKRLTKIIKLYITKKEEINEIKKLVKDFVIFMHKRELAPHYREVNTFKNKSDFLNVENYLKYHFHNTYKELKPLSKDITPKLSAQVSPIFEIDEIIKKGKLTYEFSRKEHSPLSAKAIPSSITKSKVIKFIVKKHGYEEREGGKGSHSVYVKENSPMITFERGDEVSLKILKQIAVSLNINLYKLINMI